jgi:NADH:ubiquinone reductase (H+-translocating)
MSKKIVIIGGGFAGVYTYLGLRKRLQAQKERPEITLISKDNYFLFTPLLHEVATGGVRAHDIVQPLRQIAKTALDRVVISPAKSIDITRKVVTTACIDVPYDYLVIATGATTNYFKFNPELVYTLKTMQDALLLKNHILDIFDTADRTEDPKEREKLLTFVVIGGGPTGVELVTEMDEFIYGTLHMAYPSITPGIVKLYLIHGKSELINMFHPKVRLITLETLRNEHMITTILDCLVMNIEPGKVSLSNGAVLETDNVILTTGVQAIYPDFQEKLDLNEHGQILVNTFLQVPEHPELFALGDVAAIDGQSIPQTAQAAVQEAEIAAQNIVQAIAGKPPAEFHYKEQGQLVSLGRWKAAAHIGIFNFSGGLAWWTWRTIYAAKIVGWANRFRVIVDWTLDMFYQRDISKLTNIEKK